MSVIKAVLACIVFISITTTMASANQPQKVTVQIDGLACPFCAYGLEKKLKRIEDIDKLEIKINEGAVILYFKENAKIDTDLIRKKVKEAGFTPRELQIEGKPKGQQISLDIKGMTCEGCVSRVKNTLTELDCIQNVEVNLSAEKATFICTDDKTEPTKFIEAIRKLGFDISLAARSIK